MAHFIHPAVHDVEEMSARFVDIDSAVCINLDCSGRDMFGDDAEVSVCLFFPKSHEAYARAIAAAINAVRAPETQQEER